MSKIVRITPGAKQAVAEQLLQFSDKPAELSAGPKRGSVVITTGKSSVVVNNRGKVESA